MGQAMKHHVGQILVGFSRLAYHIWPPPVQMNRYLDTIYDKKTSTEAVCFFGADIFPSRGWLKGRANQAPKAAQIFPSE
jgi:hypothetical protein